MKKKILFILLVGVFLLSGCGKNSESSIIKDLEKKINNSKSYYINEFGKDKYFSLLVKKLISSRS